MSQQTAITIGSFDGVHRGHTALICAARQAVGPNGRVVAMVFDPHPLSMLRPASTPARLSQFEQRLAWLKATGCDEVVRLEPTRELLGLTPQQFLERVMREHRPSFIVAGCNFGFGKGRSGDVNTLRKMEKQYGYRTILVDEVLLALSDQSVVRASSTMIRWLILRGRVRDAAILLGRPYELHSTVVKGEKRGRELGVPTANLDAREMLLPADGIYAGTAITHRGEFAAAVSVGTKPTFGDKPRTCEAHLIGFNGSLDEYGWPIKLRFEHWLRDQLRFEGVDDLLHQIRRDLERTRLLGGKNLAIGDRAIERTALNRSPGPEQVAVSQLGLRSRVAFA